MGEKWIDPIDQVIKLHRNISEYVMDFEKVSSFIHEPAKWKDPSFDEFLKKYFYDHFMFEEKKLFPALVKRVGGAQLKQLVQELYKEHEEMLAKVSKIREALREDRVDRETFSLVKEVFNQLLEHAGKEDDEMLPVLQKNRDLLKDI